METIKEFEGYTVIMYAEKGHVPVGNFCERLLIELGKECDPNCVNHSYYRNVPVSNSKSMLLVKAKGPGRGAFPLTSVDV